MVIFTGGGSKPWHVGVCIEKDDGEQSCKVHYYNKRNWRSPVREQVWYPAWQLRNDTQEVFVDDPPAGSRPFIETLDRDEIISDAFQLTQGRRIPMRVLRQVSDSPRTQWRLP